MHPHPPLEGAQEQVPPQVQLLPQEQLWVWAVVVVISQFLCVQVVQPRSSWPTYLLTHNSPTYYTLVVALSDS